MLSAEEARVKAKDGISEKEKEQLAEAERSITSAVKNGEMWCYCYRWLNPKVIEKLQDLGYVVQNQSDQRDGTMFKISW